MTDGTLVTPATTGPKPFVFVLMPFHPDFGEVYAHGIKAAAIAIGAYAERVDEQHFTESILERVVNQIARADAIVADMTGANPNVYYEVGYAHALNKQVVLMTQNVGDIPFDLKHRPHVEYDKNQLSKLSQDLSPKINAAVLLASRGDRPRLFNPVEIRVGNVPLRPDLGPPIRLHFKRIMQDGRGTDLAGAQLTVVNRRVDQRVEVSQVQLLVSPGQPLATAGMAEGRGAPATPAIKHGPWAGDKTELDRYVVLSSGPTLAPMALDTREIVLYLKRQTIWAVPATLVFIVDGVVWEYPVEITSV